MKLTVFTPTYNRAHLLFRLFTSLQNQTCFNFEWLVIDDGSTDNTPDIISQFQQAAHFPIRYYRKENGGKHTAYNAALNQAQGEWIVCVDSDDLLTDDAVYAINQEMSSATSKGMIAYKITSTGKHLGSELPLDVNTIYLYELGIKYHCTGDYLFALDTKLAQQHPFPNFPDEHFVPESVVWDGLKDSCLFSIVHKNLMICEYQADGYSNNFAKLMKKNPCGFCLYFLQRIDLQQRFFQRLICAGKYHCFRLICGNRTLRYAGQHRFSVALTAPLGLIFRIYYKLFRNI